MSCGRDVAGISAASRAVAGSPATRRGRRRMEACSRSVPIVHPVPPSPRRTGLVERTRTLSASARGRCASISEADVCSSTAKEYEHAKLQNKEGLLINPKDRRVAEIIMQPSTKGSAK